MAEPTDLSLVRFTQKGQTLLVGYPRGVDLYYTTQPWEELGAPYTVCHKAKLRPVIAEGLYDTKFVIFATNTGRRPYIALMDMKKETLIVKKHFQKPVRNVKMNRKFFAVCLENTIRIFTLCDAKDWHNMENLPSNLNGVMDMAEDDESCLIAYPGTKDVGDVALFDPLTLEERGKFAAHGSLLAAVKFNASGTLLATASVKGTVIRVFSVVEKTRIHEFRRGMSQAAVSCMSFSSDSQFLCLSSNKQTVHVFKLDEENRRAVAALPRHKVRAVEEGRATYGWNDYFADTMASVADTVASVAGTVTSAHQKVTDLVSTYRAFATLTVPGTPTQIAVVMVEYEPDSPAVLVATQDGFLYYYTVAPDGGECTLVRQHQVGPRDLDEEVGDEEEEEEPEIIDREEVENEETAAEEEEQRQEMLEGEAVGDKEPEVIHREEIENEEEQQEVEEGEEAVEDGEENESVGEEEEEPLEEDKENAPERLETVEKLENEAFASLHSIPGLHPGPADGQHSHGVVARQILNKAQQQLSGGRPLGEALSSRENRNE